MNPTPVCFLTQFCTQEKEMEMDDDMPVPISPPSFKSKLKNSLCFSCCFRRHPHNHRQVLDSSPRSPETATDAPSDDRPTLVWMKTSVTHDLKDDMKDKCMTIFSRIGNGNSKHRRHHCSEFKYDPLSYSLNFEDGFDDDDEAPLRNFSSRLPPPPPVKPVSVREIAAVS